MQPRVRDVVRDRLIAYADLHAIQGTLPKRSPFSFLDVLPLRVLQGGFAVLLVAVSMGGIAYASNDAMPGERLYAVKTGVIEPLESALLYDAQTRATWNAILAERRLAEAAALATEGRLDEATRADLEKRFAFHAELSNSAAEEVRAGGNIEVALAVHSDLEARLNAHADLFSYIAAEKERPEASKLLARIAEKRDVVAAERQKTETEVERRTLAYGSNQIDAAEEVTEELARTSRIEGAAGGSIEARINAAREAIRNARASNAKGEGGIAYVATQAAARFTHEASILAKNRGILALAPQPTATQATEEASAPAAASARPSTTAAPARTPGNGSVMLLKLPGLLPDADEDKATTTDDEDSDKKDEDKGATADPDDDSRDEDTSQDSQDDEDSSNEDDSSSSNTSTESRPIRDTVERVLRYFD